MVGIGGHAEADDLAEDGGVASEGGVEGFEGEDGCSFTEGHTVAIDGEGPAAEQGDDAHAVPGAEEAVGEGGLVSSGDGGVDHS